MIDARQEALAQLNAEGFSPDSFDFNGEIHRFSRRSKKKNAWAVGWHHVLRSGRQIAILRYGDWKTGEDFQFKTSCELAKREKTELAKTILVKNAQLNERLRESRARAVAHAEIESKNSVPLGNHPYLIKKGLRTISGARQIETDKGIAIFLTVRGADGKITGSQKIFEDGFKLFGEGQENSGNFIAIPQGHDFSRPQDIYLVEGVATGQTIYDASGCPVACAMSAHNLRSVAERLLNYNPRLSITVAGDDDRHRLGGNIGREKAEATAAYIGAPVVFPTFDDGDRSSTDFNDVLLKQGPAAVSRQLEKDRKLEKYSPVPSVLAGEFIKSFGATKLVCLNGEYFRFNGVFYDALTRLEITNLLVQFLQRHPKAWRQARSSLTRDILMNVGARTEIRSCGARVFFISEPDVAVGDLISLKNGLLNLDDVASIRELSVFAHSCDFFTTASLPFLFDPNATCPTWSSFLNEMLPNVDTQKCLQEWIGLNMVFDTSFQKFAIFVGDGANGKTVICAVMRALLGRKSVSAVNLDCFDPKRTFPLAATIGRLANILEELNVSSKTEEGEIKKFVSGNLMTIERKNVDAFEVIPTARLSFATNVLPRINDSSDAIWRRALIFPFKVQILDPNKQNRKLTDENFWLESGELGGIFNWALEGLFRLRKNGVFKPSQEMAESLADFKMDSNPTREFILSQFRESSGAEIPSMEAYELYAEFMKSSGHHPLSMSNFAKEVSMTYPSVYRPKNAVRSTGERLRVFKNLRRFDTADTSRVNPVLNSELTSVQNLNHYRN